MEPYLQRHPYTNNRYGFPYTPYLSHPISPLIYNHFNFFLKRRSLTCKVTPILTSDSDSTPRFTQPTIFTHLPTSILTCSCSVGTLPPTSPLWKHQFRIRLLAVHTTGFFSRLSTSILTFREAVEPYLQRHPYGDIKFGFASSRYLP